MKLRLLNASHSALAYLGYLAGHETIAATMTDDRFARVCPSGDGRRRADADDARGHRPRRLQRVAAAALCQSRAAAPHLADRDGRLAEAAAAAARHHRRSGCGSVCRSIRMRSRWRAGCVTSPQRTNRDAPIDVRDPLAPKLAAIAGGRRPGRRAACAGAAGSRFHLRRAGHRSTHAQRRHRRRSRSFMRWVRAGSCRNFDPPNPSQRGTTAVASISTRAAFSTRRTTCTSAIAG